MPECLVNYEERGPEVRIIPGCSKAKWLMWLTRAPTIANVLGDAALLDVDISQCLRTEIGYVSECRIKDGGLRSREIKTVDKGSVDLLEWCPLDLSIPSDVLSETHCDLYVVLVS